jgi:biopolymer transport protein TolR
MKIKHHEDKNALAEINIVPLVDIMLVLLIIFMITAPMLQEGIDINLPEVSAGSVDVSQEDYILNITEDGQIYINNDTKERYSIVSIEEKLMAAFKDRANKAVYLRADQTIRYGYVVEVMAALRRAGIEKIGMITHTPEDEKEANKKISQN